MSARGANNKLASLTESMGSTKVGGHRSLSLKGNQLTSLPEPIGSMRQHCALAPFCSERPAQVKCARALLCARGVVARVSGATNSYHLSTISGRDLVLDPESCQLTDPGLHAGTLKTIPRQTSAEQPHRWVNPICSCPTQQAPSSPVAQPSTLPQPVPLRKCHSRE